MKQVKYRRNRVENILRVGAILCRVTMRVVLKGAKNEFESDISLYSREPFSVLL